MKKALVLFDGSNFYNKVKKLFPQIHLTDFDYAGFVAGFTKTQSMSIIYYVGEIKQYEGNKKSKILYANQQKLFTNLRNQNIDIKLGISQCLQVYFMKKALTCK